MTSPDPVSADPVSADPVDADPAGPDLPCPDLPDPEPARPEPASPEPARPEPARPGPPRPGTPRSAAARASATEAAQAVVARYAQTRERIDRTAVGHVHRRIVEIDLTHQALILAALAFMAVVPLLVSLAAVVALGESGTGSMAVRLGLSAEATRDVQQLFPASGTVAGATTVLSTVLSVVSAFSWPAALRRGFELAWGLPRQGLRSLWRPLLWLATVIVVGALAGGSAPLVTGWDRAILLVVFGLPLLIGWAWWSQHLLLGGRIGWRDLLPGAVAIGIGLLGLRLVAGLYLSTSITQHYDQYGPLGIVFALLSWLIAFSTVLLGGALLGAALHEHRRRREDAADSGGAAGSGEGLSPAAGDADRSRSNLASERDDAGS